MCDWHLKIRRKNNVSSFVPSYLVVSTFFSLLLLTFNCCTQLHINITSSKPAYTVQFFGEIIKGGGGIAGGEEVGEPESICFTFYDNCDSF